MYKRQTLRAILPQLEGTCAQYEHIDKLPRIYPAVEYSRTPVSYTHLDVYKRQGTDRVIDAGSYANGENDSEQGQGLSLFIPHITK